MGGPGVLHQFHDTFDPPFQHFRDILRNAGLFHKKWEQWPMPGWLVAFEWAGLIASNESGITVMNEPDAAQIERARPLRVPSPCRLRRIVGSRLYARAIADPVAPV